MKKLPRERLQIGLFKVQEKLFISEMLEARGIVGHAIAVSWKEEGEVAVAVQALVQAAIAAKLSGHTIGCEGAFVHSGDSRGVVTAGANGAVGYIGLLGNEAHLRELAGLLQVTVGDGAFRVVKRHKVGLDVGGKRLAPCVRLAFVVIEHASHIGFGCISGAQEGRLLGHNLCQVGRSLAEAGGQ